MSGTIEVGGGLKIAAPSQAEADEAIDDLITSIDAAINLGELASASDAVVERLAAKSARLQFHIDKLKGAGYVERALRRRIEQARAAAKDHAAHADELARLKEQRGGPTPEGTTP